VKKEKLEMEQNQKAAEDRCKKKDKNGKCIDEKHSNGKK